MRSGHISSPLIKEQKFASLSLLIKLTLNCGLSAFSFGYFLACFNSISFKDIISIFHLQGYPRALTQGLLTGSICFTAALGTIISRTLISRYSRRQSLMILSCCVIFLCLLSLIANAVALFITRLLQGLVIGGISCLTPLYMRQMMPKQVSGPLWSLHQVLYVSGLTFSFVLVFILGYFLTPSESWRIIFGFPIILCILQLINFQYFYRFDTPKWYILQGDQNGARQAISFIYKPQNVQEILKQIIEAHNYSINKHMTKIQESQPCVAEVEMDMLEADGTLKIQATPTQIKQQSKTVTNNPLAVFAGFFIISQQQLLGNMVVVQYVGQMTLKIFPSLETTFPAFINVMGLVGAIACIEVLRRWGRKELLVFGAIVCMTSLLVAFLIFWGYDFTAVENNSFFLRVILLISFLVIRVTMSCIMGPVPWLYIAEILQPNIVPLCFLSNWVLLGTVSISFPLICQANGGNPSLMFFIFFIVGLSASFINPKVLIETKGKSELQIRKQYDELWK